MGILNIKNRLDLELSKKNIKEYNKSILDEIRNNKYKSTLTIYSNNNSDIIDSNSKSISVNRRVTLSLSQMISEKFLNEVKRDLEDAFYLNKPVQQHSMFRRTPEELSSTINSRPQLISLFSANFSILSCKILKVLNIKNIKNKLKKCSFEYKLNEEVTLSLSKYTYEVLKFYLKFILGSTIKNKKIDKNKLLNTLFKQIKIYRVYEENRWA
ncbi:hypothetical protein NEOKW01_1999 [Nematocida sp. AWRm80]|nr:hypothetical protein NEOKW01_1999 [Nematocida sp. AWRm80]